MKKSSMATAFTAIAIVVFVPFALAQRMYSPDAPPPAATSRAFAAGPGMMGGNVQGQSGYEPGAMRSNAQGPSAYAPGMMGDTDAGWMRELGWFWTLILLVLGLVGLAARIGGKKPT